MGVTPASMFIGETNDYDDYDDSISLSQQELLEDELLRDELADLYDDEDEDNNPIY